ncbi:hypothetical protein NKH73_24095 [Mesorhizobium sp. M0938]|uniref:hypothetical protein n=1 Tax=unclassified Mesorhizobium TaxID=325217 RepID=UPI003335977A
MIIARPAVELRRYEMRRVVAVMSGNSTRSAHSRDAAASTTEGQAQATAGAPLA